MNNRPQPAPEGMQVGCFVHPRVWVEDVATFWAHPCSAHVQLYMCVSVEAMHEQAEVVACRL